MSLPTFSIALASPRRPWPRLGASGPLDGHPESAPGSEGDERLHLDASAGNRTQAKAPGEARDDGQGLEHREVIADALARPAAEREVGERRSRTLGLDR